MNSFKKAISICSFDSIKMYVEIRSSKSKPIRTGCDQCCEFAWTEIFVTRHLQKKWWFIRYETLNFLYFSLFLFFFSSFFRAKNERSVCEEKNWTENVRPKNGTVKKPYDQQWNNTSMEKHKCNKKMYLEEE